MNSSPLSPRRFAATETIRKTCPTEFTGKVVETTRFPATDACPRSPLEDVKYAYLLTFPVEKKVLSLAFAEVRQDTPSPTVIILVNIRRMFRLFRLLKVRKTLHIFLHT